MEIGFDMRELEDVTSGLMDMAQNRYPRETKRFMAKQGSELRKQTARIARSRLKHKRKASDKKSYMGRLKRGKVYHYLGDPKNTSIRVYNSAPHGHLIEDGHVVKVGNKYGKKQKKSRIKDPKTGERFVPGKHILRDAQRAYADDFEQAVNNFVDDLLEKGLH